MQLIKTPLLTLTAAALALTLAVPSAQAAEDIKFFKGKTATYVVATGAGGGFDFYGRLISQYMQGYLKGSTFVVRNLPGAGHIIGTNYIYNSKPNGLTMGTFNTAMFFNQILGKKGVKYDLAKMNFLGKASTSPQIIMVNAKLPYKSIAELRAAGTPLKMATGGPGSGRWIFAKLGESGLNLKFRMIPGYDGPDAHLAMLRGEVNVMMGSVESNLDFHKQGKGRILVSYSTKRDPDLPGVPTAFELSTTEDSKQLARLTTLAGEMWRVTGAPPAIPAGRLEALHAAYKYALTNPKLQAAAKKAGREVVPAFGKEVTQAFKDALNVSPRVKQLIIDANAPVKVTILNHTGKVTKNEGGGRKITLMYKGKPVSAKVSGSRSKVTIKGKKGNRKNVKPGMTCTFVYLRPGAEAKEVNCK
ncbi:MAG: tripartite-type tricarboxylate transporter receptor subunit TctC [Alphaproteobacteria bacterium]|jgi:tripartite-type tricarboxylate transporter receptor subunit TctC